MTPQFCAADGDCYRACIATVLNLPASDVPHFAARNATWDEMFAHARDWLRGHGLGLFRTWCSAGWTKEKVLECFSADNPDIPLILMGHSGRATSLENHAVVAMNGEIVHDPGQVGLDGPCLNGEGKPGWWYLDIVAFGAASGMSAGTAETQSGSGLQPASPTAKGGDAQ